MELTSTEMSIFHSGSVMRRQAASKRKDQRNIFAPLVLHLMPSRQRTREYLTIPAIPREDIDPHLIGAKPSLLISDWMLIRWRVLQNSVRPSLSVHARTGRCEGGARAISKVNRDACLVLHGCTSSP